MALDKGLYFNEVPLDWLPVGHFYLCFVRKKHANHLLNDLSLSLNKKLLCAANFTQEEGVLLASSSGPFN